MVLKLGKRAKVKKSNIIKFKDVKGEITLPSFPIGYMGMVTVPWGMMANGPDPSISPDFEGVGDCECASEIHKRMIACAMGANPKTFTSQDALTLYENACGYNPADPSTDQGCEIQAVLEYLKQQGIIDSYLELDNNNITEVYESIYLFGSASLGIQMCQAWMDAVSNAVEGQEIIWGAGSNDGSILGGHAIPAGEAAAAETSEKKLVRVVGVTSEGDLKIITYGMVVRMTIAGFNKYVDEGWVSFDKEELDAAGVTPAGFDFAALETMEQEIVGQSPTPISTLIPTYLLADPVSGKTGDTVNLTATLQDTQNNSGVPNESITFSVDGTPVGTAITDSNGLATLPYPITQDVGDYKIDVDFAGDATYDSTEGINTLTVSGDEPQPSPDINQAITCLNTASGCINQALTILNSVQIQEKLEGDTAKIAIDKLDKVKEILEGG